MNLQSIKRQAVPLHAEVAAMLRHQILNGDLAPGTRLPALRELTEQLGVARMTVVQAMNTLSDEGLIEKHSGRGTFVKDVQKPERQVLQMKAPLAQLHSMVSQLEVTVIDSNTAVELLPEDGGEYRSMQRLHSKEGEPFCRVDIHLNNRIFAMAPERFTQEIVVTVLKEIGIAVASARQNVTISYADFNMAQALNINVNAAVFRVFREFFDTDGNLIYSANLTYPGDRLELEIEFAVDEL
jgi:GntR family transcriptional regulator